MKQSLSHCSLWGILIPCICEQEPQLHPVKEGPSPSDYDIAWDEGNSISRLSSDLLDLPWGHRAWLWLQIRHGLETPCVWLCHLQSQSETFLHFQIGENT